MKKWYVILLFLALQVLTAVLLWNSQDANHSFTGPLGGMVEFYFMLFLPCILAVAMLLIAGIVHFTASSFYRRAVWQSFFATIIFWPAAWLLLHAYAEYTNAVIARESHEADLAHTKNMTMALAPKLNLKSYNWNEEENVCDAEMPDGEQFSFQLQGGDLIYLRKKITENPNENDTLLWVNLSSKLSKPFLSPQGNHKLDSALNVKSYRLDSDNNFFSVQIPAEENVISTYYGKTETRENRFFIVQINTNYSKPVE